MSDIEEELREYHRVVYEALRADKGNFHWRTAKSGTADMCLRAADEIEYLRTLIKD